jgi:hypothetical protein
MFNGSDDNIRAYMTTAYGARGMLEIVKKNKTLEDVSSYIYENSKAQLQ